MAVSEKKIRRLNIGIESDGLSHIYKATGNDPEQNMRRVIDLIGGIEAIIQPNDIVVLKPNAQWWNQGMTNTDAMKAFISAVLEMPGFSGEIIIADNHQYKEADSRGWTTQERNGTFNYNELVDYFNQHGFHNVTKYQWRCAGNITQPMEGDASGGKRVSGPAQGDGYCWREDIFYETPNTKKCLMTYPIFTSRYSGYTVDLKKGVWKDGAYINHKAVKLINFSALNHHSFYGGATASVKNLMGILDLTCGYHGDEPSDAYNAHFIGISDVIRYRNKRLVWRLWELPIIKNLVEKFAHKTFHYTGGAIGTFIKSIKAPDLNIITAHWVGWGSRIDAAKSYYPKTILASKDPVALDLYAIEKFLFASTPRQHQKLAAYNNPKDKKGPIFKFLNACFKEGVGNINGDRIKIVECRR